ncbi:MAG: acyl-CoA dehydrogenase family protein [Hyphomicrobiales bacterium]|nr:acyl-CoA dehydrogenase family protein [Hyphomicrobiales bacterium]
MTADLDDSAIIAGVRTFVEREIAPRESALEAADGFPQDVVDKMAELGLFGMAVPESFGGLDLSLGEYVAVMEELAAGWSSLPSFLNSHCTVARIIADHGTDDQRARYLPVLASGEMRAAIVLTEPSTGSDLKAIRTTAQCTDDGGFVLNGTKTFITNGLRAKLHLVLAKMPADTPAGKPIFSLHIVEANAPGLSVTRVFDKMGFKHVDTAELLFDAVRLAADSVVGLEPGNGLHQILSTLESGRLAMAGTAIGLARRAVAGALQYAKDRTAFGVPIAQHQAVQIHLANMATRLIAARALTRDAIRQKSLRGRADMMASMAKLFASEAAMTITQEAMRVLGGYGYVSDFPIERLYREAPLYVLTEGTNEIQRMIIARSLMKPDGPSQIGLR